MRTDAVKITAPRKTGAPSTANMKAITSVIKPTLKAVDNILETLNMIKLL